jgi:hypothetical protein
MASNGKKIIVCDNGTVSYEVGFSFVFGKKRPNSDDQRKGLAICLLCGLDV